jgi:hypothetical protein
MVPTLYSSIPKIEMMLIEGQQHDPAVPSPGDYGVLFSLEAKSEALPIILISRVARTDCSSNSEYRLDARLETVKQKWFKDTFGKIRDVWQIPISQITFHSQVPKPASGEIVLYCNVQLKPQRITYSERRVVLKYVTENNIPGYDLLKESIPGYKLAPVIIVATDFEGYDGFSMSEAQQLTASEALNRDANAARQISNEVPELTLRWRDTESLLFRDATLILAGAVFGLAGAFLVEWIKAMMDEGKETRRSRRS